MPDEIKKIVEGLICKRGRSILNAHELLIYQHMFEALDVHMKVSFQTSLGALFSLERRRKSPNDKGTQDAIAALDHINKRRTDFLITDDLTRPLLVIEYDGPGHNRDDKSKKPKPLSTVQRDAILDATLNRAGVPVLRLTTTNRDSVVKQIRDALNPPPPPPPVPVPGFRPRGRPGWPIKQAV